MTKKSNIILADERKKLKLTQADMADKLGITINYLSLLENGHKPLSKKVENRLISIIEKSNTRTVNNTQKSLSVMATRQPNPAFTAVMSTNSSLLSQVENCARDISSAYYLCRAIGVELQFMTLVGNLKEAIERPEDPFPAQQVIDILDKIRSRDYLQNKEKELK